MTRRCRLVSFAAAAGVLAFFALPASARPVVDCPLAKARYSAATPLLDLLIDPRSRRLIDEAGLLARLPPMLTRTTTPSFAAIISLDWLKQVGLLPTAALVEIEAGIEVLPIRRQDTVARCARYASDAAPLEDPRGGPAVLVFERSSGFRDAPSVDAATAALRAIGRRRGWHVIFTSNTAAFTPSYLRRFAAVVWNNVSGDVLTVPQRRAFRHYVERGGGFVGVHGSGGDPVSWWDWYVDELIGARFAGHPDAHQTARLSIDGASAITRGIKPGWVLKEEWYSFERSPRETGARILVTIDEKSYEPTTRGRDLRMGDHPVAWTRCVGHGRAFYSAIGHRPEVYADERNVRLMTQGIAWAMTPVAEGCPGGRASSQPRDDWRAPPTNRSGG